MDIFYSDSHSRHFAINCFLFTPEISNRMVFVNGKHPRGVVAYASQMLTNSTPETSPSFTDVDMRASAAGYTVHKIFRHAGEMIADGEGALRAVQPDGLNINLKYV